MNKLILWINKNNSNRNIIIFASISVFCYLLMGTKLFGINSDFDTKYMLDLVFYYSGEYFLNTLNDISNAQIGFYQITHYIDYLFILTFYPSLVLILSRLLKSNFKYLMFIPVFSMMFDLFENLIIDFQLTVGVSHFFASICGIFTALKFSTIILSIIVIIFSLIKKWIKHA